MPQMVGAHAPDDNIKQSPTAQAAPREESEADESAVGIAGVTDPSSLGHSCLQAVEWPVHIFNEHTPDS